MASLGTAVAAFSFGRLAGLGPAVTVPLAFGLTGVGIVGLGLASAVPAVIAFAVVTGLGSALVVLGVVALAVAVAVRVVRPARAADPALAAH